MDELRRYCEANFPDREIAYEIITGRSFVKSMESYITENPTDLIAMTRRKRKGLLKLFIQSVTGRFLFGINAPLLIFHS
jgi:nucleotide-binding universal stress UspA family protein